MINKEKAMTDFIDSVVRMDFNQLVLAQAHLSEHIHNMWLTARQKREEQHEKAKQGDLLGPTQ
jgi:hypothetical protein